MITTLEGALRTASIVFFLFKLVPWVGMLCVIVAFRGHTTKLFDTPLLLQPFCAKGRQFSALLSFESIKER